MPAKKAIGMADAKDMVITAITHGASLADAMESVGRTVKAYENWRAVDPDFKEKVDKARLRRAEILSNGKDPGLLTISFEEFRERFLGSKTFDHQRNWIDLLEGREPRWIHPSMEYHKGRPDRVLINVPPNHAKSMTLTIDWLTYKVCVDPQVRIIIVSKTQTMAKDFLYAIKVRLTSPRYAALQAAYGGPTGFKSKEAMWSAERIFLADEVRDSGEKDPTIQAIGMGGQIYGARSDIIILDDVIVGTNAGEFEKQIRWITTEVQSRLPHEGGMLAIIGTRIAPVDLYSEIINPDRYMFGEHGWTVFRCPAVLEFAQDPKDWVTLWPRSDQPWTSSAVPDEDGLYPRWDGPAMHRMRGSLPATTWSLVYQQQAVSDDSVFHPVCVNGSIERRRKPGPLRAGAWGHPRAGMEGQYVIASMDPAMTGDTFTLVGAVERSTQKRRIMNAWVQSSPTPQYFRDLIKAVTEEYGVNEWVIEQNAFQLFLVYDEEIQTFCRQRGVKITPHYTSRNKQDPDFGVASVAPLFGGLQRIHDGAGRADHDGNNLIELPDPDGSEGIKALIAELITWQPGKLGKQLKQDGPMALWFFELRAREALGLGRKRKQQFMTNPYLSKYEAAQRAVVSTAAYH